MSHQEQLNLYIRQVHQRLRLRLSLRGVAMLTATALVTTFLLVLFLNAFAFPLRGLTGARLVLLLALVGSGLLGIVLPLLRMTRRRAAIAAETSHPEFQQRLVTFDGRAHRDDDPFLELLAADTLSVAREAEPARLVSDNKLYLLAGGAVACLGVLAWLVIAGPGFVGYGASLLWTGPKAAPLYDLRVLPGDVAVRRNSDQLVTAQVIGLKPARVRLFAHYQKARTAAWEPVAMQPDAANSSSYQFLFAALPEDVEYYVEAGPLASRHFKVRVVDLPSIKHLHVTYRYPKWAAMPPVSEDHGGDLRAIEGTTAELTVQTDKPLRDGQFLLDDGQQIKLSGGDKNTYSASLLMQKDGAYHLAAIDQGQSVRLSEDYFIATDKANPPQVAIDRPAGDYRASPIEEVTVGIKASGDFGLNKVSLHYSVNGGSEKTIDLPLVPGATRVSGASTLSLEDFKLVPGDLVSLYATAKDGHAEARTDMAFIQADRFEREFSQSQQMASGGGGGGKGQGEPTDISKREKELIGATWKRQNDKAATGKDAAEAGKFLSEAQSKLQAQALALAARMDSRDLSSANDEFNSFAHDIQAAASAMTPSAEKLKQTQWQAALPAEQKALQYLLRAEATFRKIEVAFGQQQGGGGAGGGAGRDLASLFDLELDTEKNQYETAQTGSAAEQHAKAVDEALDKLDALARRQDSLAQQQHARPQTMEERWQQEMLRREAEQLQKQMEQMAQNQQGQPGQPSEGGQPSKSHAAGSQSLRAGASGQDGADPRVTQALNRLREAGEEMKQSAGQQQGASQRAAEQLRQAAGLMNGVQKQQAAGQLDSLARESDRLGKEERAQAERLQGLSASAAASPQDADAAQSTARLQQRSKLAEDRQQLTDDLSQMEKNLRDASRGLAPTQPQTSGKLRDALNDMDQADLANRAQRTADWLRRGISPTANGMEDSLRRGLDQLRQQVHEAQGEALKESGPGKPTPGAANSAALDHLERLRGQVESLTARGANSQSGRSGQQLAQNNASGDLSNRTPGGAATGSPDNNINTGNNHFGQGGGATAPGNGPGPADTESTYQQGLSELTQLRHLAQNDPRALKEIQDLVRTMQHLDPRSFPGNPAMVEQLHAEVLSGVDKLELQLSHDSDTPGQVRTTKEPVIPPGYEEAVAEYFRRLGKGQ